MRLTIVAVWFLVLLSPLLSSGGPIDDFQEFGKIKSIVGVFEHGWILGGGVEFIDHEGHSLKVCIGFLPEQPHWGFRIGTLHPVNKGSEIIKIGSRDEAKLVDLIVDYLNENFTYSQQQRIAGAGALVALSAEGSFDSYLINMLNGYRRQSEIVRWLNANFTAEQQDALSKIPFREIDTDVEREAIGYIRNLNMGIFPANESLLRSEFLENYDFVECGHEPLVIESVSTYYDGGTVGVAISDSSGCLVEFCFDHGMSSITQGAVYVGSRSPTSQNSKLASISEEQRVVKLIKLAVDKAYPKDCQQELLKLKTCPAIPKDDYRAWKLLRILRGRGDL